MLLKISGKKYGFEIFSEGEGNEFSFFIRATDKATKRTSCINNLNTVLSWLDADIDDPRFWDLSWVVKKKESGHFAETAKKFLSDISLIDYLEKRLDEDRECGEWENIIQHQKGDFSGM